MMIVRSSAPTGFPNGYIHPLTDLSQYNAATFADAVKQLVNDPAAVLSIDSQCLLDLADPKALKHFLNQHFDKGVNLGFDAAGEIFAATKGEKADVGAMVGAVLGYAFKKAKHAKQRNPVENMLSHFVVSRPCISLDSKERMLMLGAAGLTAHQQYDTRKWIRHLALTCWNSGNCILTPMASIEGHQRVNEIQELLTDFLKPFLPDHHAFIAAAAADVSGFAAKQKAAPQQQATAAPQAPIPYQNPMEDERRWMTPADIASSPVFTTTDTPAALVLGYHPASGQPLLYDGHESLITIAGPGSGKSQAHVLPNLLRYPGSCIVLDVKGELWRDTAGYRQAHFGPVFRFAPTDPTGASHRYNPFDFISTNADQAAIDCSVFSYQVVAENPKLSDPFWESKGRDFIWAFAMVVALKAPPEARNLETLAAVFGLPVNPPEEDEDDNSEIGEILGTMRRLGQRTGIPDLISAANAFEAGRGTPRLESILDTARRYLSVFARSAYTRTALSSSDWTPQQLRRLPGTTIYICLAVDELKTFGPIVRLMLTQHARILSKHSAKPSELPITFFLDEMPQLGNFESILEVQDVGRGAGLRLWMFAQAMGQLSKAFGRERYESVVDTCRVRCFMNPDNETAKFIAPNLGDTVNAFTGEKKPLAAPSDLMGRAFSDKVIVTVRGDNPVSLNKRYAYQTLKHLIMPPPVVTPRGKP